MSIASGTCGIVLIGMPGAGKSTLGVLLAKALARPFVDTDLLIQQRLGSTLQEFLDAQGYLALRSMEERVLIESSFQNEVIATGGSVVYSDKGMQALRKCGPLVYLKTRLETVLARVDNAGSRGLACLPGASLEDIFNERCPLYERYADATVEVDDNTFDQSLARLLRLLKTNYQI